ncbi:MAG: ABC transporter permease [Planctomycetota bacterium]|nr:ABC transporter permease [Planctomycetota bacterium]
MGRAYHPLRELLLARSREFFREPETVFWVYVFPLILMAGLGLAFAERGEPEIWVRVSAGTAAEAEELARQLGEQPGFVVEKTPLEEVEALGKEQRWDITVIRRDGLLEYRYDRSHPEGRLARLLVDEILQKAAGREDPLPSRVELVETPGSRYIDWLVPGLLGMNIMGGGLWGVGFVAVDMRLRKLLKRLRATPMRRSDFLVSLIGCRFIFLVPEMAAILLGGYLLFGTRVEGALLSVAAIVAVGAASFASLGLLLASRAQRIETISGLLNASMLPMWLLSGVFFPSERFPDAMQPVIQALPLTQLNAALRAVILEGSALHELWVPLLILTLWGGIAFPLALKLFRWR